MEDVQKDGLEAVKMPVIAPIVAGAEGDWCQNTSLSTEKMTPLAQRMALRGSALSEGLGRLRILLGEEKYDKYIDSLPNLTSNGSLVLIVAHDVMQRSMIERECIPHIKEAFGVTKVQVVG